MAANNTVCVFSKIPGLFQALKSSIPSENLINIAISDASQPLDKGQRLKLVEDVEILLTDPSLIKQHGLIYLPKLKWMQTTFAGVDPLMGALDKNKPFPTYKLTRAGNIYGPHMAEYVISNIIAQERQFLAMSKDQERKEWNTRKYEKYRLLPTLSLGIIGAGQIGQDIANAAKVFGMTVWGMGSQEGSSRNPCEHIDYYRGPLGLAELLSNCDYVCNILPNTPSTCNLLSGDVLSACKKKKSVFINIGRGNVIREESIIKALSEGWIRAAILDVFETEPLPATSLLWHHPQVTITPHCSALGQTEQMKEMFLENYRRYQAGTPLSNVVVWENGY